MVQISRGVLFHPIRLRMYLCAVMDRTNEEYGAGGENLGHDEDP